MKRERIKSVLQRAGVYPAVRHAYRRVGASGRAERAHLGSFYKGLVRRGDLCFDVGANLGQTTEALIGCGARVVCVEPNPLCAPTLEWAFGRDPGVTLVKKAVGARPGSAVLNYEGTNATASIRGDWSPGNRSAATVEVTTLDRLIDDHGRPTLCKVDVEGFEVEVFRGLSRPIPLIYFELHRDELDRAMQVLEILSGIGPITAANLVDEHHAAWLFDDWVPFDDFCERLRTVAPRSSNAVLKMFT